MSRDDLDAQIAVIARYASELRKAGVSSLTIGDVTLTLHAPEGEAPAAAPEPAPPPSALNDAVSYGWPEGTPLPGFRRPEKG